MPADIWALAAAHSPDEPPGVNSLSKRGAEPVLHVGVTVIARTPWQALQAQLTTARALVEAGDREKALQAIEAALAIDPNFLAAHDLRARILSTPARAVPKRDDHDVNRAHPPLVSTENYAKFEQRVKRRRVDRDVNEAQAALYDGRLKEATAALAQITELDPNSPELKELTAQLDVLRRGRPPSHRGRWFAATAAVGGLVLGGLYVFQTIQPMSTPAVATTSRVSLPDPIDTTAALPARTDSATEPVTGGIGSTPATRVMTTHSSDLNGRQKPASTREPARMAATRPDSVAGPPAAKHPCSGVTPDPGIVRCVDIDRGAAPTPPAAAALTPVVTAETPAGAAIAAPAAIVPTANDEEQVKEVLDRYRAAYERLTARSARDVWPEVDEAALARAFAGLRSQKLTFDDCDLAVSGNSASATCHGSTRYVPKVGSQDPCIEPRIWSFRLRKNGTDWKIESMRAEASVPTHTRAR